MLFLITFAVVTDTDIDIDSSMNYDLAGERTWSQSRVYGIYLDIGRKLFELSYLKELNVYDWSKTVNNKMKLICQIDSTNHSSFALQILRSMDMKTRVIWNVDTETTIPIKT